MDLHMKCPTAERQQSFPLLSWITFEILSTTMSGSWLCCLTWNTLKRKLPQWLRSGSTQTRTVSCRYISDLLLQGLFCIIQMLPPQQSFVSAKSYKSNKCLGICLLLCPLKLLGIWAHSHGLVDSQAWSADVHVDSSASLEASVSKTALALIKCKKLKTLSPWSSYCAVETRVDCKCRNCLWNHKCF